MNIKTENFIHIINIGSDRPYTKWRNTNGIKLFDIIEGLFSQLSWYGSIDETIEYLNRIDSILEEYEKNKY